MNRKLLSIIWGSLLPMALLAGSGDVNGDGIVDTTDLKVIISHIMGEQPENFNIEEADANGDNEVNMADVVKIIHSQTDKNEIISLNMNGQTQNGNANSEGILSFDQNMISTLHLEITMPQAGNYKAVILETDGRLPTMKLYNKVINKYVSRDEDSQAESSILALTLDGVQLSDDNLVLDVYLAMLPVDLTTHTLKIRVYDEEGNVFPVNEDLGGRAYTAGETYEYQLTAEVAECSGLPLVFVNNADRKPIVSKEVWLEGTSYAIVYSDGTVLDAPGKIKGRGNSTWKYDKKPYAVKFEKKQKPFGFPANKNWVLLAESCDPSLLRTAYMCAISKATGIEWTINYQYVNLFLNGEYMGVYVFTDKVEKSENRINIKKDGFIIEDDHFYENENLYFVTYNGLGRPYTFKYPDDEKDIVKGDDNYLFIESFMNQLESSLMVLPDNHDDIKYMDYLDVTSFAKYHVANSVFMNFDPNLYYVLPSRQSKLKMMPLWDSEWSMGSWITAWHDNPYPIEENTFWETMYFFKYLMKSPAFKEAVKEEWALFMTNVQQVKDEVESVRLMIAKAQVANFKKWPSTGRPMNYSVKSWQEEVERVNTFFDERVTWMDNRINNNWK